VLLDFEYLALFKTLDIKKDGLIDSQEWREAVYNEKPPLALI
jgi:hypothetical protein